MIRNLIAQSDAESNSSDFYIDTEQEETRLFAIVPKTTTYVRNLYWSKQLSTEEFEYLLDSDRLEVLHLSHNDVSWSTFGSLSEHKQLRRLVLSDCALDVHWTKFLQFDSLHSFAIGRITLPPEAHHEIPTDLSHLDHFGMTGEKVRRDDLEFLREPTASVNSLALSECDISPDAIDLISTVGSLRYLSLSRSRFDASNLAALRTLKLTSLNLAVTAIGDDDVAFIPEMSSLEYIYLAGCDRITRRTRDAIDQSKALSRLQMATFGPLKLDPDNSDKISIIDRRQ